jgi:hypothetical protein
MSGVKVAVDVVVETRGFILVDVSVGMSAAATARKVGTPAVPFGAAKIKLAVLLA